MKQPVSPSRFQILGGLSSLFLLALMLLYVFGGQLHIQRNLDEIWSEFQRQSQFKSNDSIDIAERLESKFPSLLIRSVPLIKAVDSKQEAPAAKPVFTNWQAVELAANQSFIIHSNPLTGQLDLIRQGYSLDLDWAEKIVDKLFGRKANSHLVSTPFLTRREVIGLAGRVMCEQSQKMGFSLVAFEAIHRDAERSSYTLTAAVKSKDDKAGVMEITFDHDTGDLKSIGHFSKTKLESI